MTTGTSFLFIPKVVGDNGVYDGGHGAFFLGCHPSKLLQPLIGYKAYDPIWARDTGIHGFWHMGQFAADYRAIYGELPSKTLRRN
jgi:hypothetical protein